MENNLQIQPLELALDDVFVSLVKVLHLSGNLAVADLANEIGNTIDFRLQRGFSKEQLPHLIAIYEKVLVLEPRLERLAALKSQPPSDPSAS